MGRGTKKAHFEDFQKREKPLKWDNLRYLPRQIGCRRWYYTKKLILRKK